MSPSASVTPTIIRSPSTSLLRPLFGQISVLENGHPVTLTFRSKEEAQQFGAFVRLVIQDTGRGNGYDGYWPRAESLAIGVDTAGQSRAVNLSYIQDMSQDLCRARACRPPHDRALPEYIPLIGRQNGVIVFEFDPSLLPPRTVPQVGDRARVVDHDHLSGTARVTSIADDIAVITSEERSLLCSGADQVPTGEAVRLPLRCLMKLSERCSNSGFEHRAKEAQNEGRPKASNL